ncbi:unnamed protein product [Phytophthora fragariaefolia]|uniref:Unnamed protein product n=1 Tax=Phytophthora fragariaefolia TaxID=1490495 RepID=A0A9W7CXY5_9STRA|nr:unnamed protein product [Phytophthora fragariaefolia]
MLQGVRVSDYLEIDSEVEVQEIPEAGNESSAVREADDTGANDEYEDDRNNPPPHINANLGTGVFASVAAVKAFLQVELWLNFYNVSPTKFFDPLNKAMFPPVKKAMKP